MVSSLFKRLAKKRTFIAFILYTCTYGFLSVVLRTFNDWWVGNGHNHSGGFCPGFCEPGSGGFRTVKCDARCRLFRCCNCGSSRDPEVTAVLTGLSEYREHQAVTGNQQAQAYLVFSPLRAMLMCADWLSMEWEAHWQLHALTDPLRNWWVNWPRGLC